MGPEIVFAFECSTALKTSNSLIHFAVCVVHNLNDDTGQDNKILYLLYCNIAYLGASMDPFGLLIILHLCHLLPVETFRENPKPLPSSRIVALRSNRSCFWVEPTVS